MIHPKRRKAEVAPPDLGPFQDFLNAVGASVVVLSPDRKILYMNEQALRAWGEEGVGQDCFRALRNGREECADCPFDEILETHRWLRREMRMPTRYGWRTHENLYLYARGADPNTQVIAMVSMDVHDTRSLKQEVLKERELSRALLGSVNSLVLGFDSEGEVEFVNHTAETATGYTEREIRDGGGMQLLVPADSLQAAVEYFSRPPEAKRPDKPALIPVLTKAGSRRMVSWTYSPLLIGSSDAGGGIALGQDVTERYAHRREVEKRAIELEIVNSVLARVGSALDFDEMLSVTLDELLALPAYIAGSAYILDASTAEARRIAARGFKVGEPPEVAKEKGLRFPATAVFNKKIEVADKDTKMHREVREVMEAEGHTGLVAIPVFPGGHPLGLLLLGYQDDPSPEELGMEVLRASTEALELGAENAFLRVKAEERAREATALLRVSQALTGTVDVNEALMKVSQEIAVLVAADMCGIFLFEENSDIVRLAAGYPPGAVGNRKPPDINLRVHKAAAEVARTLEPLVIYDVEADDRVPEHVSRDYGIKSSMHVPLVAEGKFIGAIYVAMSSRQRQFTSAEASLVESIARQSSIAIRNASLMLDLRESEERYRAILENSGVGFIIHDGNNILYANERAGRIIGRDTEQFKQVADIVNLAPPEDREMMLKTLRQRMTGDDSVRKDYDVRLARSDGSVAVVQLIHTPMTMGGRKVVLVAANDVTDRVEAEQAVKGSEQRYRTLIESSRDAIITADPKGRILFANRASSSLTGKKAAEMIGNSVYQFVHPDEKDATRQKFVREWEAGRGVARFPVRSLVKGAERFFEVATAILGEPGPNANVMLIASDVTERVLAREALEDSEEKYRTIVETTHDAIVAVNRAGEILFANQAVEPMFAVSAEEAKGRNVFSFVHPDDRDAASRELTRDFKAGKAAPNYSLRCLRADGSTIFAEVNSGLVGWPGDDAMEILVIRDITERRQREEERERQLKVEEALSTITAIFVDPADMNQAILRTLEDLSDFLGGNRAFYVEIGGDGHTLQNSLEWSASGEPFAERLRWEDAKEYPYLYPRLSAGQEVVFESVEELPEETAAEFRDTFGIDSFAAMPIFVGDGFRGVLGYTSIGEKRRWSQQDLNLLREIARTISRALERREFVEELARSERFRTRITESIGEGLVVISNGIITWANSQMSELSGYSLEDLTGQTTEILMPEPGLFPDIATVMVQSLAEAGVFSAENKLKRKNGTLIDVHFYVTSLGVTEGGVGEVLLALQDITESKQMREEVEAAAEAYSTLFSSAGDAYLIHTMAGNIIGANESAVAYTGFSREELLTRNITELVPERLRVRYDELESDVMEHGITTFETRLLRKDGSTLPAEASSRLTRIWGETVVLSALRDISERKKAEEETARRAAQLVFLNEIVKASTSSLELDTVLEAILHVATEVSHAEAGMVLLSNAPGRRPSSVTTSKVDDKFHGTVGEQGLRELMAWLFAQRQSTFLLELGEGQPQEPKFGFAEALAKQGIRQALFIPLYSGEKSIGIIAMSSSEEDAFDERDIGFYNAAGAEIGVSIENVLIYQELTAEHERLSLLYRSAQSISGELELQSLLDTTAAEAARAVGANSAVIGLIEPDWENFVFRAAHNLDVRLLEPIALDVTDGIGGQVVRRKKTVLIPREAAASQEERELIENDPVIIATGVDFGAATPLIAGDRVVGVFALERPANGAEFSPEDVLLLEAIGRQAGVAIQNARLYEETRRHLAALEKAHQELMVLDRMKSDFVSTVSHELRSPLAVIEGFAKTLSEHFERLDEETKRESIEIILKKSVALEGLIENLLDMSRIEEGRLEVSREPFDIVELCEGVSEDQERVEGLHEVRVETDARPVVVIADREKTEVAVGNLIRNALKFSPGGGEVTVSVNQTKSVAEISVRDEGIGIAPEQLERIFDRFYQVDSSETRSFPGSGLGLYITRELVGSMGGSVTVESERGKGSVFTFTLPLAR
ncbi:MAG TPA: PAS domain S-box protein [Candidatus Anoxymicrobiaceae bacterium]